MLSAAPCRCCAVLFAVLGTWHVSEGHEDCTELSQGAVGDALLQIGQRSLSKELPDSESELELSKELPRLEHVWEQLTGQEPAEPTAKQIAGAVAENDKNSTHGKSTWFNFPGMFGADEVEVEVKDTTTLFYHFHIPKTGGTTVANLMMADVCTPWNVPFEKSDDYLKDLCSQPCEMGLTDNMLSCYPGRELFEHVNFSSAVQRSQGLAGDLEADRIIYVTSLRRGSERVVSQWAQEVQQGLFVPPPGIEPWSNMSLAFYVSGGANSAAGWISGSAHVSHINNLQVAELADLPSWIPNAQVTIASLEMAKKVLLTGEWRIGFMKCMQQFHEGLSRDVKSVHGLEHSRAHLVIPRTNEQIEKVQGAVWIDEATRELVDRKAHFDNELYDWAWKLAEAGTDARFAGTC